jgi:hypothetical protein
VREANINNGYNGNKLICESFPKPSHKFNNAIAGILLSTCACEPRQIA